MSRVRSLALAAAVLATLCSASAEAQVRDPTLTWRTIDTPNFTVTYHVPLGVLARRVAAVAERGWPVIKASSPKESPRCISPKTSSRPSELAKRMATEPERTT